ncbi:MAG: hypothetical protein GWM92_13940 [Gemmatimonadetes bacterium]|nr:hypothetical protein [Gemmatimonadota bacterium]NIR77615.1 hypothetical protein [Gemmatimonadota bacterium]NIT88534.1 hypothetical protein [Gemmatimonadota bacterium]NIU29984.1 hypothetical protein [Gemmatimonadota bacterium]NIU34949.1 hypothetical protein [Gemmatimonadota bacterium]
MARSLVRRARSSTALRLSLAAAVPILLVACGGRKTGAPPTAGHVQGAPPDLRGHSVMLLPVQSAAGISSGLQPEAEIAFALQERAPQVRWILPDELRSDLARAPALGVPLENLPVGVFLQAEVQRVGDPLYGHLRRIAGLSGADVALIPVAIRYRRDTPRRPGAVEIAAALVSARTGHVFWFAVVDGRPGSGDDPRAMASAADALARAVAW